jgi:hypothetical protein
MGKGSGDCHRPGVCLETGDGVRAESELHKEINTTLEHERAERRWWTKDERVVFQKKKEGWIAAAISDPARKAFEEYGIIYQQAGAWSYEYTRFPSLKAARQAVTDVSLEAGLNIDPRLTRRRYVSYKIGDLPLIIKREKGHWRIVEINVPAMPASLKKSFHSIHAFSTACESTDIVLAHYPTRKAAHQAVTNWLSQTIAEGK